MNFLPLDPKSETLSALESGNCTPEILLGCSDLKRAYSSKNPKLNEYLLDTKNFEDFFEYFLNTKNPQHQQLFCSLFQDQNKILFNQLAMNEKMIAKVFECLVDKDLSVEAQRRNGSLDQIFTTIFYSKSNSILNALRYRPDFILKALKNIESLSIYNALDEALEGKKGLIDLYYYICKCYFGKDANLDPSFVKDPNLEGIPEFTPEQKKAASMIIVKYFSTYSKSGIKEQRLFESIAKYLYSKYKELTPIDYEFLTNLPQICRIKSDGRNAVYDIVEEAVNKDVIFNDGVKSIGNKALQFLAKYNAYVSEEQVKEILKKVIQNQNQYFGNQQLMYLLEIFEKKKETFSEQSKDDLRKDFAVYWNYVNDLAFEKKFVLIPFLLQIANYITGSDCDEKWNEFSKAVLEKWNNGQLEINFEFSF